MVSSADSMGITPSVKTGVRHTEEYKQEKKDYQKAYRIKNKEAIEERRKARYLEKRDIILARTQAWRDNNRDRLKEYNDKYKAKNREAILERERGHKLKLVQCFGNKCKDCLEGFHPAVYEFHHRIPKFKTGTISKMYKLPWKELYKEALKTDMLCRNCHCYRHIEMRGHKHESKTAH